MFKTTNGTGYQDEIPPDRGPKKKFNFIKFIGGTGIGIVTVILLAVAGLNSVYTINEQEQAVLVTLGQASSVTTPGLHFKIPFIQDVIKVDTTIQGFSIGYDEYKGTSNESESLMITSDYNFVNVDFFVEYRFSEPVKAVYASSEPVLQGAFS